MGRRETTNPDTGALTPQQEAAVDLLAVGRTVTEVAIQVGVARQTVSEWLNRRPGSQAALNQRWCELWLSSSDRLRALLPKALDVLETAIDAGSEKAALGLLKAAGLHGLEAPSGPTTVEDAEIAAKQEESARGSRALLASIG